MDRKEFAYWGLFIFVAVYATISLTSFAKAVELEQDLIIKNLERLNGNYIFMQIATIKTNEGDIVLELFNDSPITVGNFVKLSKDGFYDGIKFHRVINNFIIQGGDPNSKGNDVNTYGTGGPGYRIEDEFIPGRSNKRGTISMANAGPNTGGSQFFINLVDNINLDFDKEPLTSKHPVFGRVIEGMDVVSAIGRTPVGARDLPIDPIIIETIEISER